jgi:hypothetical protein
MSNIDHTLLRNYIHVNNQLEIQNKQASELRKKKKEIENKIYEQCHLHKTSSMLYRQYEISIKKHNQFQSITQDHIKLSLHQYFKKKGYSDEKIKYYSKEIMTYILETRIKKKNKILHIKNKNKDKDDIRK